MNQSLLRQSCHIFPVCQGSTESEVAFRERSHMTSVGDIEIIHIKKVGQICFLDPLTLFLTLGGGGGGG